MNRTKFDRFDLMLASNSIPSLDLIDSSERERERDR